MENEHNIKQSILKKIEHGEVRMRPKYYFVAGSILLTLGTLGVILAGTFFVNHIIFMAQHSPSITFLGFGPQGFLPFLQTFPWISLVIALSSIWVGFLLLRHYDFSYKTDSSTFVIIVIATIIGMGVATNLTGINEKIETFEPVQSLYERRFDDDEWVAGIITKIEQPYITLYTPHNENVVVHVPDTIPPYVIFKYEQQVTVIGSWEDDIFVAEVIQTPRFPRYPRPSNIPFHHMR